MLRRVKQYLECLEMDISTDEFILSELSKELEPPLAPAGELTSRWNTVGSESFLFSKFTCTYMSNFRFLFVSGLS